MSALRRYLCDLVRMEQDDEKVVSICRSCESQCAYGREYVHRYDAGERPLKRKPRKKTEGAKMSMDADKMKQLEKQLKDAQEKLAEYERRHEMDEAAVKAAGVQLTDCEKALRSQEAEALKLRKEAAEARGRAEKFAKALAEQEAMNAELEKAVSDLEEKNRARKQEAEEIGEALRQSEEQRHADKLMLMRLKARMWDMEHANDDF